MVYLLSNQKEKITKAEINRLPNLSLAYVGDAVFELLVRDYLINNHSSGVSGLHNAALKYVSAPAQAEAAKKLLPYLTEDETAVYKRGRNTKVNSVPHNATVEQYHAATGLETLFGYLYLLGDSERIAILFEIITGE